MAEKDSVGSDGSKSKSKSNEMAKKDSVGSGGSKANDEIQSALNRSKGQIGTIHPQAAVSSLGGPTSEPTSSKITGVPPVNGATTQVGSSGVSTCGNPQGNPNPNGARTTQVRNTNEFTVKSSLGSIAPNPVPPKNKASSAASSTDEKDGAKPITTIGNCHGPPKGDKPIANPPHPKNNASTNEKEDKINKETEDNKKIKKDGKPK